MSAAAAALMAAVFGLIAYVIGFHAGYGAGRKIRAMTPPPRRRTPLPPARGRRRHKRPVIRPGFLKPQSLN